ncbi:arsenical-resistance protein ACR3 [Circinella umbellata]|nr:arsenical-resistance protein ACR3 [Circinella umbellata]
MIVGVLIGYYVPNVQHSFETVQFDTVSVPIAIGLLLMMYPIMVDVKYEKLYKILTSKPIWIQIAISILINFVVGPIIMAALAWGTLPDLLEFRAGVVLIGLARCIAMVLIWVHLAHGDDTFGAMLVAINSLLQIGLYSPYAVLFINIIPSWFGAEEQVSVHVEIWPVAESVLIYLGIPLVAGLATRYTIIYFKGRPWFENKFVALMGHLALIGLLYTIFVMFIIQGHQIIENIGSVFRTAVPLIVYFCIMFFTVFFSLKTLGVPYDVIITQAFTGSSNNFELAIAVAVGTYGIRSEQALSATVGALIEVPVLLTLTHVAILFRRKLNWNNRSTLMTINKEDIR